MPATTEPNRMEVSRTSGRMLRPLVFTLLLVTAGVTACAPADEDEGELEPGAPLAITPGLASSRDLATSSLSSTYPVSPVAPAGPPAPAALRDVRVEALGENWAELTWTSVPGADGFGVWVAHSEPAELLGRSGLPGEEYWPTPSTSVIEWAVQGEGSEFAGSIFVNAVDAGSCSFPVPAAASGNAVSCRVENLPPGVPVVFLVRPFSLPGSATSPGLELDAAGWER